MITPFLRALALVAIVGVSACASLPQISMPSLPGSTPAAPERASAREYVRAAVDQLNVGNESGARAELRAALEMQPGNSSARRLMEQIEGNPREMLGESARTYTVRSGETMSELAERFLGDPLLFYALARYNGLEAPNQLSAGQTLSIPRRAHTAATNASATTTSSAPSDRLASVATPSAPPPRPAGLDPARAGQLRLQGLQRLNTGDVNGAVGLLRQALALDNGNPANQRDLDRAVRMQTSLRAG